MVLNGRPARCGRIYRTRIERVIDKIARAIHYHSTNGSKLIAPLSIHLPSLRLDDGGPEAGKAAPWQFIQEYLSAQPWIGDNPEVFRYRLHHHGKGAVSVLWMEFYEGFEALVGWGDGLAPARRRRRCLSADRSTDSSGRPWRNSGNPKRPQGVRCLHESRWHRHTRDRPRSAACAWR